MNTVAPFAHRANRDGSFDSICLKCFATATRSSVEADLARGESEHLCDPEMLERLRQPLRSTWTPRMTKQLSLVDVLRDTLRKIEGSDDENKHLPMVIELTEQLLKSLDDLRASDKAVNTAATSDPGRTGTRG